jgi:protein-disulfide isomerase
MKKTIITFLLAFIFLTGVLPPSLLAGEPTGPVFKPASTTFDLGVIPENENRIAALVPFVNRGDQTLEIIQVNGNCDCYQGFEGDKVVEPGKTGFLEIFYDKDKIPSGIVRRNAKIKTNDTTNPLSTIFFDFTINRDPEQDERWQLRNDLRSLRKEIRIVRSDLRKVLKELAAIKKSTANARQAPKKKTPDTTIYNMPIKGSPVLGSPSAQVTIVEFVDFQCPYCIREYPKMQQLMKEFPGRVRLVFKHFPLTIHKKAPPVHAASEMAFQEKGNEAFWKMHDMILAKPKKLDISQLRLYAQKLNMNLANFDKVLADKAQIDNFLRDDLTLATKCKVRGTPTVLINGLKLADRRIDGYRKRIKQILADTKKQ